ncbi:hypothetical protein Cgig2_026281 [Carnegiea gigantea]|uniref:Uncharacterized protein n=1 Tax=Carnegiea gigantea TaxID=171969 RepID=A0A9Q1JQN8_9CARY|nr:hypothetical protein Cgig2_026281 [Carnegiea gigantea]
MNLFPNFASVGQAAEYIWDTFFLGSRRKAVLHGLHGLCPHFDLKVATQYAHNSNIPEMVQAIFYAMVVDDAAKLGLSCMFTMDCIMWAMWQLDWNPVESWLEDVDRRLTRAQPSRLTNPPADPAPSGSYVKRKMTSFPTFQDTTHVAEYFRDNLYWSLRESSDLRPRLLPLNFHGLCPEFAIFYAMVINEVKELGLSSRDTMRRMMLDMQELRWDIVETWSQAIDERLRDAQPCPEVTSRLRGAPSVSSDDE